MNPLMALVITSVISHGLMSVIGLLRCDDDDVNLNHHIINKISYQLIR